MSLRIAIHKLISPKHTYVFLRRLHPWFVCGLLITLLYGLWAGLVVSPPDYQQGDIFRIIYIHVPLAIGSLGVYVIMTFSALIFLIWPIKLADMIAKSSASIGFLFTVLTLITGSIWGKPTWGTWWVWDARLTAEAILLFLYVAVMAVRSAMPEPRLASRASAIVTLLGAINIPIVHYSVNWWHTLHQGATILKWGSPSVAPVMLYPLLSMMAACFFYYLCWMSVQLKHALLFSEKDARWVKELV